MEWKIFICIKQVMDTSLPLKVSDGVIFQEESNPVYYMNAADRCALEEAMFIKQNFGAETIAISVGGEKAEGALLYALKRGADKAVHLFTPEGFYPDPSITSHILAREINGSPFNLVFCGEKSTEQGSGQTGPLLAEILDIPQITRGIHLESLNSNSLVIRRLLERGNQELILSSLPALVTFTRYANQPRYIAFARKPSASSSFVKKEINIEEFEAFRQWNIEEINYPRPRPRKISAPASTSSASDRFKFLMSGGKPTHTNSNTGLFEGSAEQAADRIIQYLQENGFIKNR